ncbi:MAG TPA: SDR family oxidoreductase [Verrucomicrobiae bacterium]|jgi:NAD(P)-dependent dehydrogenase (short-subunit alcohol dehydrogenase family)
MFDLKGRTAVITGGGSGIGRAIAELFARRGAVAEILDVDEIGATETVRAIEQAGGAAAWQHCDISDQAAVRAAFEGIGARRGPLHILVNNAGVAHIGTVLTTDEADFDRIYRVNVKGVYNCLKLGVEKMSATGGGVILNIASLASLIAIADRFAYSMSKGAVLTMTYSVAKDFLKQNIRCNAICPSRIHTPFVDGFLKKTYPGREAEMFQKLSEYQPVGRMGRPDEVASLALFLCSDEASFITGVAYPLDGGAVNLR